MLILMYHFFIGEADPNLWRRSYEGAPCLYYRKKNDFEADIDRFKDTLITIDDAHISVYKIAYPILKKAKRKFILFVPTNLVGTKGYCNWEQIKEMSDLAEIGSHGHNHLPFDTLTPKEVENELKASYNAIKEHIGRTPRYVSCPASKRISKEMVQKCGYEDIRFNLGTVRVILNRT